MKELLPVAESYQDTLFEVSQDGIYRRISWERLASSCASAIRADLSFGQPTRIPCLGGGESTRSLRLVAATSEAVKRALPRGTRLLSASALSPNCHISSSERSRTKKTDVCKLASGKKAFGLTRIFSELKCRLSTKKRDTGSAGAIFSICLRVQALQIL